MLTKLESGDYRVQRYNAAIRRHDRPYAAYAQEGRGPAIVITHDCEIDKNPSKASVVVAKIRPISGAPEAQREGLRDYTRHRAFYVPAYEQFEEGYADLRALTMVRREALAGLTRVASMNEDGRQMLREHLFRFFTRRVLPPEWLEWEEEEG
jgi:hypothetical protein